MIVEIALLILKFGLSSFLISLPFLYDLSPKFRYYFKFFVYYWLLVLVNLVLAPVATWTWTPICRSNPAILSFLHRTIGYILNIRWKIIEENASNINQPCIVVTNQQNLVDILGVYNVFTASRRNTIIRFQKHHNYFDYLTCLISVCNPVITYTEKDLGTVVYSTIMKEMKNKKANVWIFCENVEEFDTEILSMALREHIPVVPLIISDYYFIDSREKIFDPGYIYMKVLPQLNQNQDNFESKETSTIKNMQLVMRNEFKALSEKVTPPTLEALWQSYSW